MALGANVQVSATFNPIYTQSAGVVAPVSVVSGWVTIISANGPTVQDAATITNPTTQITASTRSILQRLGFGTNLLLRLAYDASLVVSANPIVKVFGRLNSAEDWQLLKNRAGAFSSVLYTAATDLSNAVLKRTTPDIADHAFDCCGCNEIIVGVETVLAGTGVVNTSIIEAKVI